MSIIDEPFLSIITPTRNSQATLNVCIESVSIQTYRALEHIIIDGESSDRTLDIIEKYAKKHPHIRFISEKDEGIYHAMNKGIDMALGKWIFFLGSDDALHNATTLDSIFSHEAIADNDIVYGNIMLKNSGTIYGGKYTAVRLLFAPMPHQATFYRSTVFKSLGVYDQRFKILADWAFTMKWFNDASIRRAFVDIVIAVYGEEGASTRVRDEVFHSQKEDLIRHYFPEEYLEFFNYHRSLEEELLAIRRSRGWKLTRRIRNMLLAPNSLRKRFLDAPIRRLLDFVLSLGRDVDRS